MGVTIQPVINVVRYLESIGVDPDPILATAELNPPLTRANINQQEASLTWNQYASIFNNLAPYISTNEGVESFSRFVMSDEASIHPAITRLLTGVRSTAIAYSIVINLAARRHFYSAEITSDLSGPQFTITMSLPKNGPPSELYLRVIGCIFELVPEKIGLARALVTTEITDFQARYTITPPPGHGLLYRLKRRFQTAFLADATIKEMVELEVGLQKKFDILSQKKADLERNLDEYSKRLRTANQALSRKIRELELTEEISGSGAWTIDRKKNTVRISANVARILELPVETLEINHSDFINAIHPEDRKEYSIALNRLSPSHPDFYIQHRVAVAANESERIVRQRGRLINEDGQSVIIGSVLDITTIHSNEFRLKQEKEAALEASRNKSQFLASMSHEIRTPMTSVLGFAELIVNPKSSPEKISSYVETILRNGRHLLVLIDDILDLSKVEAGHLRFNIMRHKTRELIGMALENIRSQAVTKGISINLNLTDSIPEELATDATRFNQIINNVLGNAIKFTDAGTINVSVTGDAEHSRIQIIVEDQGKGIAPEFSKLLFRPYSVFDMDKKKGKTGTGLGLALAKALAKAMGGDVALLPNSEDGGCRFGITIGTMEVNLFEPSSVEKFSIPVNILSDGPLLKGRKILIVEDNKDIQEILSKIVRDAGADIELADNGLECLERFKEKTFDMVLMDLQMPVLDGFETLKRLRADGYKKPIIIVTAYALNDERERAVAEGCTDFVTKPINSDLLLKTLARHR